MKTRSGKPYGPAFVEQAVGAGIIALLLALVLQLKLDVSFIVSWLGFAALFAWMFK